MSKPKGAKVFVESGTLTLVKPLRLEWDEVTQTGKELTQLHYDFDKVTGMKCLDALDKGHRGTDGQAECSDRAGFLLFAEAVRVCHSDVESADLERLHAKDVVIAARIGKGFFLRTCVEALMRIGVESPK